jgi:putative FmdB family regulatory protein
MPMYTYTCLPCDKEMVLMQKMEQRDAARCPECGYSLIRGIDRPGSVWAPTAGGFR